MIDTSDNKEDIPLTTEELKEELYNLKDLPIYTVDMDWINIQPINIVIDNTF